MARTCVFCQASKPTREHVLPVWITAELPGLGPFRFDQEGKRWSSKDAGKIVKAVCAGCNNGWMSVLEEEAKPLLAPAIRGEKQTLSIDDQPTVATWAAKTALMYELARISAPSDFLSRLQHQHLFHHREPAPGTYVWMSSYQGPKVAWNEQHRLELLGSTERDPGLATIMSIGHLVLQVIEVPAHIELRGDWPIPRLWPGPEAPLSLPPLKRLSDEDLRVLSQGILSK